MLTDEKITCPHCTEPLDDSEPNPETGWDQDLMICNNYACAYFIKGRKKLFEEYDVNFAYRYCYNPANSKEFPLVCWCGGDLSLKKGRCGDAMPS